MVAVGGCTIALRIGRSGVVETAILVRWTGNSLSWFRTFRQSRTSVRGLRLSMSFALVTPTLPETYRVPIIAHTHGALPISGPSRLTPRPAFISHTQPGTKPQ